MRNFFTLKEFIWKNRFSYIFGIFWLLSVDLLQLVIPKILGNIFNQLQRNELTTKNLLYYSGLIVLLSFFIFSFRYLWRMYIMGAARKLEYELRNRLFKKLLTLSVNYFNQHKTGDLMAHATNDINAVRMAMGPGVVMAFDALIMFSLTIFMMVKTISWNLTLVALIPLPIMSLITRQFGKVIHTRFRAAQDSFAKMTDKVQENIAGIRVVKAFVLEEGEIESFTASNQDYYEKNLKLIKIQAILDPAVNFISGISLFLLLSYGGYLIIQEKITLGDFVAFNGYLGLLTWPIMAIGWLINLFQRGAASLARLNKIFDTQPEIIDDQRFVKEIKELNGEIRVENLSFQYPGQNNQILKNISFRIERGKTLAIVGRTGSGKSTIANLLTRLYNPPYGTIFLDNHEIHKIPLQTLREKIGIVPQEQFLFSDTIRNNLAFALDDVSDNNLFTAARLAHIYDDIMEFPDNFSTVVGERGVMLSGGQKQRIAIARAIIKDPPILILDDSLSAVDTKTEEIILENLREFRKKRTTIIIAHRISTIKDADEIIVLDNGEIIERGTHQELIDFGNFYYNLYQEQKLEDLIQESDKE